MTPSIRARNSMTDFMLKFIASVRRAELLWNTEHPDNDNWLEREALWAKITKENNLNSVAQAKKQWKTLRDVHRGSYRKHKNGLPVTWVYYKHLEFLNPHLRLKRCRDYSKTSNAVNAECSTRAQTTSPQSCNTELKSTHETEMPSSSKHFQTPLENEHSTADMDITDNDENTIVKTENTYDNEVVHEIKEEIDDEIVDNNFEYCYVQENITDGYSSDHNSNRTEENKPRNNPIRTFFDAMCEATLLLPEDYQLRIKRKLFDIIMEAEQDYLN